MKTREALNSACSSLVKDQPGKRFQAFFERIRDLGFLVKLACILFGILLMLAGLLLGLIPGIPGILFGFIGVGLIAAQFKSSAVYADKLEVSLRKFFSIIRGLFIKPAPRVIEIPVYSPAQLEVNGVPMPVIEDGQHTGLESRFEEETAKALKKNQ